MRRRAGIALMSSLFAIAALPRIALAQELRWAEPFGMNNGTTATEVVQDGSGVYVIGEGRGSFGKGGGNGNDLYLRKYSPIGQLLWEDSGFGTGPGRRGPSISGIATNQGGVVVVGRTLRISYDPTFHWVSLGYVRQYSQDGDLLWTRTIGVGRDDVGADSVAAHGDAIYVSGTNDTETGERSFLLKLGADGSKQWIRWIDAQQSNIVATRTAVFIAGLRRRPRADLFDDSQGKASVERYGEDGRLRWKRTWGHDEWATAIEVHGGGLYVAMRQPGLELMRRLDLRGRPQWVRTIAGSSFGGEIFVTRDDVLMPIDTGLRALSIDGSSKWRYDLPLTPATGTTFSDVPSVDGVTAFGHSIYACGRGRLEPDPVKNDDVFVARISAT
jgi:hypothetical protein